MAVAPPRLCNNSNGVLYKEAYSPSTNLIRVNLCEVDELQIGMADNRSTNTPVGEGWRVV